GGEMAGQALVEPPDEPILRGARAEPEDRLVTEGEEHSHGDVLSNPCAMRKPLKSGVWLPGTRAARAKTRQFAPRNGTVGIERQRLDDLRRRVVGPEQDERSHR